MEQRSYACRIEDLLYPEGQGQVPRPSVLGLLAAADPPPPQVRVATVLERVLGTGSEGPLVGVLWDRRCPCGAKRKRRRSVS